MAATKTYQAVTMFFPADPRNVEILFKTQEVYSYLRAHQLKLDPNQVDHLIKHGVVGQRVIKGRGKKHSVQGYWSLPQRELLREALTLLQRDKAKVVDVCAARREMALLALRYVRRPPHLTLYAVGAFKLANLLVNLGITAYTERWSALAPAGVLM